MCWTPSPARCAGVGSPGGGVIRGWLAGLAGQHVELAVEGCTGWRFVIEECQAAGVVAHLAEPAEVAGLRGRRRHAKTDRIDARHLRDLLLEGRLPECWIPPQVVLETRVKVRLKKDLADQRTGCSSACTPPCITWAPRPSVIC